MQAKQSRVDEDGEEQEGDEEETYAPPAMVPQERGHCAA